MPSGGQIEDALEGLHRTLHFGIVGIAAGTDGGNGRIIAADAVEPGADGADIPLPAANGKRRPRIGRGDAALYRGGINDDVIAVVITQNAQRRVAVIGQGNGAPTGKGPPQVTVVPLQYCAKMGLTAPRRLMY